MGRRRLKEELITMVEKTLKQNRPDERFTEAVLTEIIDQTKAARKRREHDEIMRLCEKALEVLDHLETTPEHQRTRIDVLTWQGDERLTWYGMPEGAMENFRRAVEAATAIGDKELQVKSLLMQAVAFSRMGEFKAMVAPVQRARDLAGALDWTRIQVICDAMLELANLLPEGWTPIDDPPERHSGHGIHRYCLIHSANGVAYVHENEREWQAWGEVMIPRYMRRGYELRSYSLLARIGQFNRILAYPLEVGHSWEGNIETQAGETLSATRTIEVDSDTVVVPAGRFENCLRVTTVIPAPADADFSDARKTYQRLAACGKTTMWFARGVGLVKYRHDGEREESHTVQLLNCQVNESDQNEYFPLSTGNRWKYEGYIDWCRKRVTEGYRIVAKEGETVHVACAMYSDILTETEQRDYFQAWMEHEKASSDPRGQIWMLLRLATVYARLGERRAAEATYRRLDERMEQLNDSKLKYDLLSRTEWANPPAFVAQRMEQALQIVQELGDQERYLRGLRGVTDFYLRNRRYADALQAAQQALPIARAFGDVEEQVFIEADIDLAQALMADPDGDKAIKGGVRSQLRVKASESEITHWGGGGVWEMAGRPRPHPPINAPHFWSNAPLLKLPVKKGESWTDPGNEAQAVRVVESTDETIAVPAGTFNGCVRVKTTIEVRVANEGGPQANEVYNRNKGFQEGEKWMWFAPGVGIVKAEHHHANGKRTVIVLTGYYLTEPSDAYFPLAVGDWRQYEWRDENGELLFKEKDRIVCEKDGAYYLACSAYTTNRKEYGK
jgi:tetratricopeptide (TPR) repeat protein